MRRRRRRRRKSNHTTFHKLNTIGPPA